MVYSILTSAPCRADYGLTGISVYCLFYDRGEMHAPAGYLPLILPPCIQQRR